MAQRVKVGILGHSYVRDLSQLNQFEVTTSSGIQFELRYFHHAGARFETFLNQHWRFDSIRDYKPDITIVVLGGNDLCEWIPLKEIKDNAVDFYKLLRKKLPDTLIVATQVEIRYLEHPNFYGTPTTEQFSKLANFFNKFLSKGKFKDKLFMIKSSLSNPNYYREDHIHLNQVGIQKLLSLLIDFLTDICVPLFKD